MREHEVPTHVQAEDKVLLWFTFPQIVAVVAVCAVAYGAYRYFPLGPSEFRLGAAILLGTLGIALTVGKVGGRGLPLVAADLLKFNLGARRYAGAPVPTGPERGPAAGGGQAGPAAAAGQESRRSGFGKAVKAARKKGRPPFRPHSWFGKRRPKGAESANGGKPPKQDAQGRKPPHQVRGRPWSRFLPVAAGLLALALVALPANGPGRRPRRRPGLAAGGDLFRAARPGARTTHLHRGAQPSPATRPG